MGGIADQNDPPGMPFFELRPFHGRANNLVVALERGQVLRNAPSEWRKAVAQALKASRQLIVEAWLDDIRETVGAPRADRHKPEGATVAQVHLQSGQTGRLDRGNAPPIHGTKIAWRSIGQR
jgi:hypothetical protein